MVAIKEDADLDLAEIKSLLQRVAKSIHQQPNRVKYVMNSFVIAVACYVKPLHKLAVDTANGIGKVAVDLVGACKIPFAPDQIKKFEARSAIGKKRKGHRHPRASGQSLARPPGYSNWATASLSRPCILA